MQKTGIHPSVAIKTAVGPRIAEKIGLLYGHSNKRQVNRNPLCSANQTSGSRNVETNPSFFKHSADQKSDRSPFKRAVGPKIAELGRCLLANCGTPQAKHDMPKAEKRAAGSQVAEGIRVFSLPGEDSTKRQQDIKHNSSFKPRSSPQVVNIVAEANTGSSSYADRRSSAPCSTSQSNAMADALAYNTKTAFFTTSQRAKSTDTAEQNAAIFSENRKPRSTYAAKVIFPPPGAASSIAMTDRLVDDANTGSSYADQRSFVAQSASRSIAMTGRQAYDTYARASFVDQGLRAPDVAGATFPPPSAPPISAMMNRLAQDLEKDVLYARSYVKTGAAVASGAPLVADVAAERATDAKESLASPSNASRHRLHISERYLSLQSRAVAKGSTRAAKTKWKGVSDAEVDINSFLANEINARGDAAYCGAASKPYDAQKNDRDSPIANQTSGLTIFAKLRRLFYKRANARQVDRGPSVGIGRAKKRGLLRGPPIFRKMLMRIKRRRWTVSLNKIWRCVSPEDCSA